MSYSEAHRRVSLDHVRAARKAIEDKPRLDPLYPELLPPRPSTESPAPPVVPPPAHPPRLPDTTVSIETVSTQVTDLTKQVGDLGTALERLTDAHGSDLANAVDPMAAKYEMELSAHRQTVEQLLERQDAHISTLNDLVRRLTSPD